jgi:RNA polymerase sigma-70 factor, ECF subfamily
MNSNPEPVAQDSSEQGRQDGWLDFKAAIDAHQAKLHAFAYRLLGGKIEAEDALQNAYLKAYQASQADGAVVSKLPWLYQVVYSCCIDELRNARRTAHDTLDDVASLATQPEADVTWALSAALLALPAPSRAAVLLVDVHGLSYAEAAEVLDLPRGTIASRLNHGRQTLRQALADHRPATGRTQ